MASKFIVIGRDGKDLIAAPASSEKKAHEVWDDFVETYKHAPLAINEWDERAGMWIPFETAGE